MQSGSGRRNRFTPNVQVDVCPEGGGFILSVGSVSLWLDERASVDVMISIAHALRSGAGDGASGFLMPWPVRVVGKA
jgi:hypothetical protein